MMGRDGLERNRMHWAGCNESIGTEKKDMKPGVSLSGVVCGMEWKDGMEYHVLCIPDRGLNWREEGSIE